MNNKTVEELQKEIEELRAAIEKLSQDSSYGILNRPALDLELRRVEDRVRFVAFLDVDYLHTFNNRYGHDEANNRIRRALQVRSDDLLLSSRWYSGDEIVILLKGDPEKFSERLKSNFIAEGMSITIAYVPYSGNLPQDAAAAKAIVDREKAARGFSLKSLSRISPRLKTALFVAGTVLVILCTLSLILLSNYR